MKYHMSISIQQIQLAPSVSVTAIVTFYHARGLTSINNDGTAAWTPKDCLPAWVKAEVEARLKSFLLPH